MSVRIVLTILLSVISVSVSAQPVSPETGQVPQYAAPPRINPVPVHHFVSPKKMQELEHRAYDGDGDAALQLATHYGLVLQNMELNEYWTRIAAFNGSSVGISNYLVASTEKKGEELATRIRFGWWVWNKHSKLWSGEDQKGLRSCWRSCRRQLPRDQVSEDEGDGW